MLVKLKHYTPLHICSDAIRKCWDSGDKSDTFNCADCSGILVREELDDDWICDKCDHCGSVNCGDKDKALIDRVGNKFKHGSTLEHLSYNFEITGVSRALLQELARHRIASLSVKSTRYTLKELNNEEDLDKLFRSSYSFLTGKEHTLDEEPKAKAIFGKYLVYTGNYFVDTNSMLALINLQKALQYNIPNDKAKFCLPESYKTELAWTINARSLQNFLYLRTNKSALWEIRDLAKAIFNALPEDHKYLFESSINESD